MFGYFLDVDILVGHGEIVAKKEILQEILPRLLYRHLILHREKESSDTKLIKCVFFFVGLEEMLADSCELERASIDEGIMDVFHSPVIFGCVGSEVDNFLFVEEFLEVGKYGSDFEATNLRNFVEGKSLYQIRKCLVVRWNLFS